MAFSGQLLLNPPAMQETRVRFLFRKILWRREWLPTLLFLPGESHGHGTLVGYDSWGCKESETTEGLSTLLLKFYKR